MVDFHVKTSAFDDELFVDFATGAQNQALFREEGVLEAASVVQQKENEHAWISKMKL